MERSLRFSVVVVGVSLLLSCPPIEAWYKQATGPSYYSVGRASGLLSGIRRSPYVRRSESQEAAMDNRETAVNNGIPTDSRQISILKSMAICVKDVTPELKTCEPLRDGTGSFRDGTGSFRDGTGSFRDGTGTFRCRGEVLLSLDSLDCLTP